MCVVCVEIGKLIKPKKRPTRERKVDNSKQTVACLCLIRFVAATIISSSISTSFLGQSGVYTSRRLQYCNLKGINKLPQIRAQRDEHRMNTRLLAGNVAFHRSANRSSRIETRVHPLLHSLSESSTRQLVSMEPGNRIHIKVDRSLAPYHPPDSRVTPCY